MPDDVAYVQCLAAQEAMYWKARELGLNLNDKDVGDLLRAAAPHIIAAEQTAASTVPGGDDA